MNKAEIIAILRSAPSREIKFPVDPKFVNAPTIEWLDKHMYNYSVYEDGNIEVYGNIYLDGQGLEKLPVDFSMCGVHGVFSCANNKLTSLKGCPKVVKDYFDCAYNRLTSFEGCPNDVGGAFLGVHNRIYNLKHIPKGCRGYNTDCGEFASYSCIPKRFL